MKITTKFFACTTLLFCVATHTQRYTSDIQETIILATQQLNMLEKNIYQNQWTIEGVQLFAQILANLNHVFLCRPEEYALEKMLLKQITNNFNLISTATSLESAFAWSLMFMQTFDAILATDIYTSKLPDTFCNFIQKSMTLASSIHSNLTITYLKKNHDFTTQYQLLNPRLILDIPLDELTLSQQDRVAPNTDTVLALIAALDQTLYAIGHIASRLSSDDDDFDTEYSPKSDDPLTQPDQTAQQYRCTQQESLFQILQQQVTKARILIAATVGTAAFCGGYYWHKQHNQMRFIPGTESILAFALRPIITGIKSGGGAIVSLIAGSVIWYKINRLIHAECRSEKEIRENYWRAQFEAYNTKTIMSVKEIRAQTTARLKELKESNKALKASFASATETAQKALAAQTDAYKKTIVDFKEELKRAVTIISGQQSTIDAHLKSVIAAKSTYEQTATRLEALIIQISSDQRDTTERLCALETQHGAAVQRFVEDNREALLKQLGDINFRAAFSLTLADIGQSLPPKPGCFGGKDHFKRVRALAAEWPEAEKLATRKRLKDADDSGHK